MTAIALNANTPKNRPPAVAFLRARYVRMLVGGVSESTLWRWVRLGQFPKPKKIGANTVGWRASDVYQWLDNRPDFDEED